MDTPIAVSEENLITVSKKPKKRTIFLSIAVLLIIVGLIVLAFFIVKPAVAQAKGLYLLYFSIDSVREESAQIFAELLEAKSTALGIAGTKADNPKFSGPPEALIDVLKQNRGRIDDALAEIDTKNFPSEDIAKAHKEIRGFYTYMAAFEDEVLVGLENAQTKEGFANLIDEIFESPEKGFEGIILLDGKLQETLRNLAETYDIAFSSKSYDEVFRERLIGLRTPVISEDIRGIVVYPFLIEYRSQYIPEYAAQSTVSASWSAPDIDQFEFALEHPDGRIFRLGQLRVRQQGDADYYDNKPLFAETLDGSTTSFFDYGETFLVFKIFHDDPAVAPVIGEWKLHVQAPAGIEIVFGAIHL
ncbi:hypothetical protein IID24_04345 [Patescibacteria group bacterium]|nr:hypothetical protein [Patescibacteria group bacterium]